MKETNTTNLFWQKNPLSIYNFHQKLFKICEYFQLRAIIVTS